MPILTKKQSSAIRFNPNHLAQYVNYPREFIEDLILRFYPVNPCPKMNRHQIDMCKAIVESDWITVRSGRGRGKTCVVAWIIPWYLATRPMARVVATAPKIDLLHDVLWAEVNKWLQFSPLRELLTWTKERVSCSISPDSWFAVARTANSKENLSGYHEAYQLIIGEEASGIMDEILETIEQTQLNNEYKKEIKTILISNPTKVTGFFYKTHKLEEWKKHWKALHFKPTAQEISNDPGAQRVIRLYGMDHDLTQVSVFGEFPSGNPQAVMSYADVWGAMTRDVDAGGPIVIACDVARFGDDSTVICYRVGYKAYPLIVGKKQDTVTTEEILLKLVVKLREDFDFKNVIEIRIDDSTMGGAIVDRLRRNKTHGIEAIPCLFGGAGNDFYSNQASIMWSDAKKVIEKMSLPMDDALLEELCGRNWEQSLDNKGRQKIESKDDFKKRIHRSPDRADAFVMCVTSSQMPDKILPKLVDMRAEVFKDEPVRFDFKHTHRGEFYGSVWQEKDLKYSCLAGIWDKELGRLLLYYEGVARMEGPDLIVRSLDNICEMYNRQYHTELKTRQFTWFGNRAMFGLSDSASGFESVKDGSYLSWMSKHCISLIPNFMFDLYGSVLQLNKLLEENRIVILPDMLNLKTQLETWTLDNERPDITDKGLCLALCNIISMLVQTKRVSKEPKKLEPYGVKILPNGEIKVGGSKAEFLNKAERIFAEGHKSKIMSIIPYKIK